MIIFVTYLAARFIILRSLGGYGIPSNYSGIELYFLNYISFINQILLFTYYITYIPAAPAYFIFYLGVICVMLTGILNTLTLYVKVNRKVLFILLTVFVLLSLWFMSVIKTPDLFQFSKQPDVFETRPFLFEGLLFIMAIGLYTLITLAWTNRRTIFNFDKQEMKLSSYIEKAYGVLFNPSSNPGRKETLVKFLFYSCLLTMVSGLPMFFLPASRIMNVSALGMGGIFASSFFMVISILGEKEFSTSSPFGKKALARYLVLLPLVFFILNNGAIFRNIYSGPESIYNNSDTLKGEIISYVELYPYFKSRNLSEQGAYIFNKLVSKGLVDPSTGKLNIERIEYFYPKKFPDRFLRGSSLSKDDLYGFHPTDSKIYPIVN
ncbi:MAG: hypothetical protein HZC49_08615 [Nitrospirae bacterium]|nr:hypothetical protein [Nitrospirota bacterium]